jgi:predicted exporter
MTTKNKLFVMVSFLLIGASTFIGFGYLASYILKHIPNNNWDGVTVASGIICALLAFIGVMLPVGTLIVILSED